MSSDTDRKNDNRLKIAIVFVITVLAGVGLFRAFFSQPTDAESAEVICSLQTEDPKPLVDPSKASSRSDFANALRERANVLFSAAEKTSGETKEALSSYAVAMDDIADSIEDDSTGESLAEVVGRLASDPVLASAQKTLNDILDRSC